MKIVAKSYMDIMNKAYLMQEIHLGAMIKSIAALQGLRLKTKDDIEHCHAQFTKSNSENDGSHHYTTDTRVTCEERADLTFETEFILTVTNPSVQYKQGFSFRTGQPRVQVEVWDPTFGKWMIISSDKVSAICDG